ncbi:MAG TPA: type II secretion system secretin GspD [Rhodoferax sp.]|nr:type II secretion system secretin GspD [Rhodoferax sp.]HNV58061.1 type II secretion system secretin GspD [Rhodoferax sp.]HPW28955.1 type II secretion system secretin GspD [Rhodoferax sp.]
MLTGSTGLFPINSWAQADPTVAGSVKRGDPITLNFTNADIDAVARTMALLTGRNVVVDPRVKGTITLTTDKPVSPAQAYSQFLAMLRLQGFTVVDAAGLDKIVPEADAKLQGGAVFDGAQISGSQIATQIFRLNFENANNLLPILRPLISPNNTINVNPGNNSLVITDYGDNLRRIGQIIAAMDVSQATDVEVISLKHAIAVDLAPLVLRLLESGGGVSAVPGGQADGSFKTTLVAEPRSNTLILRAANPARLALAKSLIDKLDQQSSQSATGNIYVVYLKNAEATKLAATLRAAISGEARSATASTSSTVATPAGTAGAAGSAATATSQSSTGGQIQADAATNSLIITAPEPQYRQLRAVIDKLDARRAQVYVESLIAEVNADKAAEFGIQWQGAMGQNGDANVGLLGTNFKIGGTNIVDLATKALTGGATLATGGNFAVAHQTNGVYVLGFLARYLQANGDGNILSTPNLLTLDNEEAKIVIGQNVPFVTGQYTNTGSTTATVNPFQTIERKDVGLTLRVKPQISENGTVKLTIFQEVSSVQASSVNSTTGLITNKRSIESNVLVGDGSIVVLGGLLSDEYSGNQEKVPGLGDIPLFGNLFKAEARSRKKTNLMVFLRPVVVRDAAASDALSMDRYELMRSTQQRAQPQNSSVVPINEAPVLPAAVPPVAPTKTAP